MRRTICVWNIKEEAPVIIQGAPSLHGILLK